MAKKLASELSVSEGNLVEMAGRLAPLAAKIQVAESELDGLKTAMKNEILRIRDEAMESGQFLSRLRIASETAPVRVDFKTGGTSDQFNELLKDAEGNPLVNEETGQPYTLEDYLKYILGGIYPEIFTRDVGVRVLDGRKVWNALANSGREPFDFLTVSPREGSVEVIQQVCKEHNCQEAITVSDRIIPVKGWLENLTLSVKALSEKAIGFMKEYVKGATIVNIVLASKSKGNDE